MSAPANFDTATLYNIEIEQELLGSFFLNNSVFDVIEHKITSDDFFEPLHSEIFEAIANARASHGTITPALIIASIGGDANQIIEEGTTRRQYIARLAGVAVIPRHALAYAVQIREFSDRRKMLAAAEAVLAGIQSNQPAADIAGLAIDTLDEIATASSAGSTPQVSIRQADDQALERVQYAMLNPGRLAGVSWGLRSLDRKTSGLEDGKLYIVAGRPGMGKSALAVSVANAASSASVATLLFSLEMGAVEIANRGLAEIAFDHRDPITYTNIAGGEVNDAQFRRIEEAARRRREWPLEIDPAPGLTVSQIAARARRHRQKLERRGLQLGLLIVDHLHILAMSNRYSGSRVNEVGEASGALKRLAKELDVPVIALAQLNRMLENRESKRPTMADLRDSGSIEQDADTIVFVHREAFFLERPNGGTPAQEMEREDKLDACRHDLEAIIGKQRSGPTGTVKLFCNIACNAVRDLEVRY